MRGLWLTRDHTTQYTFNHSTCRPYDPYQTYYATLNWTAEVAQVRHKRNYIFDTFVQPGNLIQSTTAKEVYVVDEHKHRLQIPDGDTFVAKFGDNHWGDVKFIPQPVMDLVPLGEPMPSVRDAPKGKSGS